MKEQRLGSRNVTAEAAFFTDDGRWGASKFAQAEPRYVSLANLRLHDEAARIARSRARRATDTSDEGRVRDRIRRQDEGGFSRGVGRRSLPA